jgi:HD-GYP domain-containing protein (c-di-GMP phosphodiesterase class II)
VGRLRTSELLAALSVALDLTEGQRAGHALHTAYLALKLADRIGLPAEARRAVLYTALLKDAGCSSNAAAVTRIFGIEDQELKARQSVAGRSVLAMAYLSIRSLPNEPLPLQVRRLIALALSGRRERRAVEELRCERGAHIARKIGCSDEVAQAIMDLHEHWDGRGLPRGLLREAIPLLSRIVAVCAGLDIFLSVRGPAAAQRVVRERGGSWYDPDLTALLLELCDGGLLDELRSPSLKEDVFSADGDRAIAFADDADIDRIASAFADIVDAKSPWTGRHSQRVATIGDGLARRLGLAGDRLRDIRIGALLHDLGKLGVPNTILDKPAGLDPEEWAVIKRHPQLSRDILWQIELFAAVAEIAACHHERLDGKGYFRGLAAESLGLSARIVAVADVFEAMTSERPYRPAMTQERALAIMRKSSGDHLAAEVIAALSDVDALAA